MSRGGRLLRLLLAAALVAHVLMLAGHHQDGARHAHAGAIASAESAIATSALPHPPEPVGHGPAGLGAACIVVLLGTALAFRLLAHARVGDRPVLRHQPLRRTARIPAMRPLRPPQTPVADRVVLLT